MKEQVLSKTFYDIIKEPFFHYFFYKKNGVGRVTQFHI